MNFYIILIILVIIDILLNIYSLKKIIANKAFMDKKDKKDLEIVNSITKNINSIIDILTH